jgi:transposase
MCARYVNVDRETPLLLPPDLRDWVAQDDLAHFVLLAVEGADLSGARIRKHGGGSPAYPPTMMMALLVYAYANGIFGSRQIERATHYHVSVRFLCGNLHPDHDTICAFRRENRPLLKAVFSEVLRLAGTMGLLQVGTVCLDGTKLVADAAKRRTLSKSQLEEGEARLQQKIEGLLAEAETADSQPEADPGRLPRELANRQKLKEKYSQARALLGELTKERAAASEREYQQWEANRIGDAPDRLSPEPKPSDEINLTDPASTITPVSGGGFINGYNAQAALTGQKRGLVVATHVCQEPNDRRQLLGMAERIKAAVPAVEQIVVDTGYDHARHIDEVERNLGVKVYCPPQRSPKRTGPPKGRVSKVRQAARGRSQQIRGEMRERSASEHGQHLMGLPKMTIEPAFGTIKRVLGFRRFSLRGLEKVNTEWELIAVAFNCRRIVRQQRES